MFRNERGNTILCHILNPDCSAEDAAKNCIFGKSLRIDRAACTPFISGIVKSNMTRSGFFSFTPSTASRPFLASMHWAMRVSVSRRWQIALRTIVLCRQRGHA
jgi:hypothetical protein